MENRPKTNYIDNVLEIIDNALEENKPLCKAYKQNFIETGELPEVDRSLLLADSHYDY